MKKIIHLSDLHVGHGSCHANLNALVTRLIFLKKPASDYIVVMTGDIVENGAQNGLYETALVEINRLRGAGFQLLICPGNHDYGTGSNGDKGLVPKFKRAFFENSAFAFPRLDIIGGTAFIGLDTMAEELHWYDQLFAEGELGDTQLAALKTLLASAKVKACKYRVVYMHHHPFEPKPFHGLKDSGKLEKILTGKIQCLLFGHNHDGKVWNGTWGIPRCYDAGSSTRKDPHKPSPQRVMDLSRDPRQDYDGDFL